MHRKFFATMMACFISCVVYPMQQVPKIEYRVIFDDAGKGYTIPADTTTPIGLKSENHNYSHELSKTVVLGQKQACCLDTSKELVFDKLLTFPLNPCIGVVVNQKQSPLYALIHVDSTTNFESVGNFISSSFAQYANIPVDIFMQTTSNFHENKPAAVDSENIVSKCWSEQSFAYNFNNQKERAVRLCEIILKEILKNNMIIGKCQATLINKKNIQPSGLTLGVCPNGIYTYEDIASQSEYDFTLERYMKDINSTRNVFYVETMSHANLQHHQTVLSQISNRYIYHNFNVDNVKPELIPAHAGVPHRVFPRNHWVFRPRSHAFYPNS